MRLGLVSRGEQRAAAADGRSDLEIVIRVSDEQRTGGGNAAFTQEIDRIVRLAVSQIVAVADHALKIAVQAKVRNLRMIVT